MHREECSPLHPLDLETHPLVTSELRLSNSCLKISCTHGFQKPDQEALESRFCDRRVLVVPRVALHAANLPVQPSLTNTSDMDASVSCNRDPVSGLVSANTSAALARAKISVRASPPVAQPRNTSAAEWTSSAGAYLSTASHYHSPAHLVSFVPAARAAHGPRHRVGSDERHGLLGHRRGQPGDQLLSQISGARIQVSAGSTPFSQDATASTLSLQHAHAIAELVYSDPKAADRCILSVSELLRFSLESHRTQEVTLKEEIGFLEKYLEIQKTLMSDRLRVRLNVDPETLDASVPNMLLQPLVENAIKHGISPRPEGGNIEIHAKRLNGNLHVEISDDGLGLREQQDSNGVGLVNTRERLKHLYGAAHAFNLSSFPGRGVTIRISLPFREAEDRSNDTNADY